jgi:hypothetical protein
MTHIAAAGLLVISFVRYGQGKTLDAIYAACCAAVLLLGQIAINTNKK